MTFSIVLCLKIETNFQIYPGNADKIRNSNKQVHAIKISLDTDAIASIICRVVLHKCDEFLKQK